MNGITLTQLKRELQKGKTLAEILNAEYIHQATDKSGIYYLNPYANGEEIAYISRQGFHTDKEHKTNINTRLSSKQIKQFADKAKTYMDISMQCYYADGFTKMLLEEGLNGQELSICLKNTCNKIGKRYIDMSDTTMDDAISLFPERNAEDRICNYVMCRRSLVNSFMKNSGIKEFSPYIIYRLTDTGKNKLSFRYFTEQEIGIRPWTDMKQAVSEQMITKISNITQTHRELLVKINQELTELLCAENTYANACTKKNNLINIMMDDADCELSEACISYSEKLIKISNQFKMAEKSIYKLIGPCGTPFPLTGM